jgi:N-methylhydantoinase B/oxoprolinase/acetone carboxylase alpha subunit
VRRADGAEQEVAGQVTLRVEAGDLLIVETPGGGGFGVDPLAGSRLAGRAPGA